MSEFDTTFSLIDKYQKCKCYKLWLESVLSTDSLSSKIEMLVDTNLPDLVHACKIKCKKGEKQEHFSWLSGSYPKCYQTK